MHLPPKPKQIDLHRSTLFSSIVPPTTLRLLTDPLRNLHIYRYTHPTTLHTLPHSTLPSASPHFKREASSIDVMTPRCPSPHAGCVARKHQPFEHTPLAHLSFHQFSQSPPRDQSLQKHPFPCRQSTLVAFFAPAVNLNALLIACTPLSPTHTHILVQLSKPQ